MKNAHPQTTEVCALCKANSTLLNVGFQPSYDLSDTEQELLFVVGDVAGSYIAAHLLQHPSALINASQPGAI